MLDLFVIAIYCFIEDELYPTICKVPSKPRRENCSNQPVFRRRAISDPKTQGLVKITFNAQTGETATANTGD